MLAADRLNCSVFELYEQPNYWRQRALLARNLEIDSRNRQMKREEEAARQRAAAKR